MKTIHIDDLIFELLFDHGQIQQRVGSIGEDMNRKYVDKIPVFLGVLNGCFMFMADLMKQTHIPCEISFVKLASYRGTSQQNVQELLGVGMSLEGRDVIIVEDIVDTGRSLQHLVDVLKQQQVASIAVAALLLKPDCLVHPFDGSMYVGFEIDPEFVVGYGMDYKGQCRNLQHIYKSVPEV